MSDLLKELETLAGDPLSELEGVVGALDFPLEGKALASDGSLTLEGYAADFARDREGDTFAPGALEQGVKKYLSLNPVLCWSHHTEDVLGTVTDARVIPGKGLWIRAKVLKPAAGSKLLDVYEKIKAGAIKALSIGGIFRRSGGKIVSADVVEISACGVGVQRGATFRVTGEAPDPLSALEELT